ncbi:MAG: hypothetical protein ABSC06_32250 [Rhodopila sp.]
MIVNRPDTAAKGVARFAIVLCVFYFCYVAFVLLTGFDPLAARIAQQQAALHGQMHKEPPSR